jgi:hypothetical protein
MKGKVSVVLAEKDVDAIITGISEEEKGTGVKITGRYLGLHDIAAESLSLLDLVPGNCFGTWDYADTRRTIRPPKRCK